MRRSPHETVGHCPRSSGLMLLCYGPHRHDSICATPLQKITQSGFSRISGRPLFLLLCGLGVENEDNISNVLNNLARICEVDINILVTPSFWRNHFRLWNIFDCLPCAYT